MSPDLVEEFDLIFFRTRRFAPEEPWGLGVWENRPVNDIPLRFHVPRRLNTEAEKCAHREKKRSNDLFPLKAFS